jgi:hypothetical protein
MIKLASFQFKYLAVSLCVGSKQGSMTDMQAALGVYHSVGQLYYQT